MGAANLIAALSIAALLSACAPAYRPSHDISASASLVRSERGFLEFQNGLYAFVKAQNCVKCHGAAVNPMFAAPDARAAYQNAKTRVDFSATGSSKFIPYAGNNHCGDVACSNPANSATVRTLLEEWADAETDDGDADPNPVQPGANQFVTAGVNVPANLPTLMAATPAVIRFQLAQLNPAVPALAGAVLELEIQKSNPTTYRINRPKIVGNTAPVQIDGIHVFVKPSGMAGLGVEDTNQGDLWADIAVTAQIAPRPAVLPSTPLTATPLQTQAIFIPIQSATDVITVVLDNVR